MRMMWWLLISAFSLAAVSWAGISIYLRVMRHMKAPHNSEAEREVGREVQNR